MKAKFWAKVMTLLLSMLTLVACSSADENIWLKSPAWSRGVFVGNTNVINPVSFVTDAGGNTTFLLVDLDEESSTYSFNLARLESNSTKLDYSTIHLDDLRSVKQPEIVQEPDGSLRLIWIASEGLYTLPIGEDNAPIGEPVLLSGGDVVASYDIAHASDGKVTLWYAGSRRDTGIYALSDYTGNAQSVLIDADGTLVRLRYDQQDQLHTLWVHYPFGYETTEVQYGIYDPAQNEFVLPFSTVSNLNLGIQKRLDDLALGVDESDVYLFWVVTFQSGLQAGAIQASYQSFPIGDSGQGVSPLFMSAPMVYSLEFERSSGDLKAGDRVSFSDLSVPMTPKTLDFRTNLTPAGEVVLAVRSPSEHLWRKMREQVNLIYFDNGTFKDYQPLTFTTAESTLPNVKNETSGYVSIVWLEKKSSSSASVYFASTDPEIAERFDTISSGEYLNIAYTALFGMLIGALLAPIAAGAWLIAPLAVLAVFSFARRPFPPRFQNYFSVAGLIAALVSIWLVKLGIFPMMWEYVPFSAWVPKIPALVGDILRFGVPMLTLGVAGFTAWHFTYRRDNNSSLYFILIYIAIDSLITASIYAVLIYGTYVQ